MKQGQASRTVTEVKVEPTPHAINPGWVAQLGQMQGTHVTGESPEIFGAFEKKHAGRGFKGPPLDSMATHKGGSQGRY